MVKKAPSADVAAMHAAAEQMLTPRLRRQITFGALKDVRQDLGFRTRRQVLRAYARGDEQVVDAVREASQERMMAAVANDEMPGFDIEMWAKLFDLILAFIERLLPLFGLFV